MKSKIPKLFIFIMVLFCITLNFFSQEFYSSLPQEDKDLYDEHLKFGQPNSAILLIRNAYVLHYNSQYRIPNWVAYHIDPDFLNTPERKSKFARFRKDEEVENPVEDEEYVGLFDTKGYARGHLAPYKIMGGDRDEDDVYANYGSAVESDEDDEKTVFQGNYLTNIAPQHHKAINGPGGLWYKLERWIQDDIVDAADQEVWIYAGCIINDTVNIEGVGENDSIIVPNMFYKILIRESGDTNQPYVLAFLFPHFKNKSDLRETYIYNYLVPVDYIEAITGLDFFSNIDESEQLIFERNIELEPWHRYINN